MYRDFQGSVMAFALSIPFLVKFRWGWWGERGLLYIVKNGRMVNKFLFLLQLLLGLLNDVDHPEIRRNVFKL